VLTALVFVLPFPFERKLITRTAMQSRDESIRAIKFFIGLLGLQFIVLVVDVLLLIPIGMGAGAVGVLALWCTAVGGSGGYWLIRFRRKSQHK
jgi:hypothetical protein